MNWNVLYWNGGILVRLFPLAPVASVPCTLSSWTVQAVVLCFTVRNCSMRTLYSTVCIHLTCWRFSTRKIEPLLSSQDPSQWNPIVLFAIPSAIISIVPGRIAEIWQPSELSHVPFSGLPSFRPSEFCQDVKTKYIDFQFVTRELCWPLDLSNALFSLTVSFCWLRNHKIASWREWLFRKMRVLSIICFSFSLTRHLYNPVFNVRVWW